MSETISDNGHEAEKGTAVLLPKQAQVTLSRNVIYFGSDEAMPEQIPLRAGPLGLAFVSGELRHIQLGEYELLRRIYVAVRDRNWRTVPSRLLKISTQVGRDSFQINLEMENRQGAIDFQWSASITGSSEGSIRFAFDGLARKSFLKNRIGICVLHPIRECAGRTCTVVGVHGAQSESVFPHSISPHQVFKSIRSLSHEISSGRLAELCFDGETFETEDQRNWSDASYKTYCPPLDLPYPSQIEAGEKVSQSVTLKVQSECRFSDFNDRKPVEISLAPTAEERRLPRLGLGLSSSEVSIGKTAIDRLRALHLSHLRVDVKLGCSSCETLLRTATEEAAVLGCRLEAAVFVSDDADRELDWLHSLVERVRPPVCHWLIFHQSEKVTNSKSLAIARAKLSSYLPTAKFGGGTNAYFAELARSRFARADFDLLVLSLNPQVHASDIESLGENLEAQSDIVRSALRLWPGLPLAITPITLKPRFNPDETGADGTQQREELPPEVDVRQMSLFGAAWTAGSLKQLSESGLYSATYYETVGWRGVMESGKGSPLPGEFRSIRDSVFPLYHVFADVAEFADGKVLTSRSSEPNKVTSFVLEKNGARRILLSNLTSETQEIRVCCGTQSRFRVKLLDEGSAEWAMSSPESFRATPGRLLNPRKQSVELEIPPFATTRLDCA